MAAKGYEDVVPIHPVEIGVEVFLRKLEEVSLHRSAGASPAFALETCLANRFIAHKFPHR